MSKVVGVVGIVHVGLRVRTVTVVLNKTTLGGRTWYVLSAFPDVMRDLGRTMVTISANKISDTHEPSAICEPHNPTVSFENTDSKLDEDFGTRIGDIRLPHGTLKARMPFFEAGCAGALVINANEMMWPLGNGFFYLIRRVQG